MPSFLISLIKRYQQNQPTNNMRTLQIKKTASGQFKYRVIDSFSGVIVNTQFGDFTAQSTIEQARSRFSFDDVTDETDCTVDILDRDGKAKTVTMTKSCFDKTAARSTGFSQDTFLGRITALAGVAI